MHDHVKKTIDDLEVDLRTKEEAVRSVKLMINQLCKLAGVPERHVVEGAGSAPAVTSIRPDQFYGRPLATVVREYLEMRRAANLGPVKIPELFDALKSGGYLFETKNDEVGKVSLRNAVAKNPVFHKLPNHAYGLSAWYPNAKKEKSEPDDAESEKNSPASPVLVEGK